MKGGVLPAGAIPAIYNPRFVSVKEADRFLRPEEPVLGITDGKTAKACSAWQLNHHEIVNDSLGICRLLSRGDHSVTRASCMSGRQSRAGP